MPKVTKEIKGTGYLDRGTNANLSDPHFTSDDTILRMDTFTAWGSDALLVYLAAINAVTFALFCLDKARAVRGAWRIPEKVLLGCSAVGGAAGGLLGMRVAHHKTRKPLFYLGIPAMLVVQAALLAWLMQG